MPVLIAGGGLTGLSAALFLAWHGVPSLVAERHDKLSAHPRARGINPRTMELMRVVGLESVIRDTPSARELDGNSGVIATETLAGRELGALHQKYFMDTAVDLTELSPTGWCLCHQDEYEPVLRAAAEDLGADLRFGTELVSFTQGPNGVAASLLDRASGQAIEVEADYLVAADGPGSQIRASLGIGQGGAGTLAHYMNIHFDADLREPLRGRRFIMAYTVNPVVRGALMPLDNACSWLLHVLYDPEVTKRGDFTQEYCQSLVRAAAGVPDLAVRIKSVLPWEAAGRVAERFSEGRVFLAGDAAHTMPPSGAFGANLGVADIHNLAWKIAMVSSGAAGPGLLASYDLERRPVGAATAEQAVLRSRDRPRLVQQAPPPANPAIISDATVWFGGAYDSGAVIRDDDDESAGVWTPSIDGRPGTRAPHAWVRLDGGVVSTLDLFGRNFVLLTGPGEVASKAWCAEAHQATERLGVPVDVHMPECGAPGSFGLTADGMVVVRPDGVVAWREKSRAGRRLEVADALARVLSRAI